MGIEGLTQRHKDGYIGEKVGDLIEDCYAVMHDCSKHLQPTGRTVFKAGELGVGGYEVSQMACEICGGVK